MNWLKNLFFGNKQFQKNTPKFPNILVAKVLEWQKHPNADRLRVVKLDLGNGKIIEPVVCGASNFDNGSIVALALPGASIPHNIHSETHEPFVLTKAKIRGIESQGMICAGSELGLGNKPESGVMILKSDAILGSEFQAEMLQ